MRERLLQKLATPRLQTFWERLFFLALRGMNIGGGGSPVTSGELNVIRGLPKGAVVLDVGANRGQYARAALDTRGDLRIYSFEPSIPAFAVLEKTPGVKAFPFGFSETEGEVVLYSDSEGSVLASVYQRDVAGIPFREAGTVLLRRLADFCTENEITHIDLLKIDVEGHELEVLRGMGNLRPDRIQFEFGGCNIDSRTFLRDFLRALPDYTLHRILPAGLTSFRYSERMEQFGLSNFLAIHHRRLG